ncbi:MAG: hypothetical protein ACRD3O_22995 [Terriglobia bacterium]
MDDEMNEAVRRSRAANTHLMRFAGKPVAVSGMVYEKGGSRAIVIQKIVVEGRGR